MVRHEHLNVNAEVKLDAVRSTPNEGDMVAPSPYCTQWAPLTGHSVITRD
jgi:hypothetical protein